MECEYCERGHTMDLLPSELVDISKYVKVGSKVTEQGEAPVYGWVVETVLLHRDKHPIGGHLGVRCKNGS